jgi:hypothetical protein
MESKYLSIKHSSYFQVYEEVLEKYRNKDIVFIEIGVLNGGSLFMWRDFLGSSAKIIGVDFNPDAIKWREHGFEIFVGDQADENFWSDLFGKVGAVDIVLDDGGHTNKQQIVTVAACIPNIKDGGLMIVEDTHASYLKAFGNPSKYSFISFSKFVIDLVNSRFPGIGISKNNLASLVYSVSSYESIVVFHINRLKCFISEQTTNNGITMNVHDYRHEGTSLDYLWRLQLVLRKKVNFLKNIPGVRKLEAIIYGYLYYIPVKINEYRIRKFFK